MKTPLSIFILAFILLSFSQLASSQVRIGAKAGIGLADENWDNFGGDVETKLIPVLMVGGVIEFDLSEYLSFGTGIQYQGKGTEVETFKTVMSYVQIPLQLQYTNNGFFGAVGPYYAFALSGKYKRDAGDIDLLFGSTEDDDFSSSDFGANLEVGYEYEQIRVTASYSQGLANIIPSDSRKLFDGSVKNVVFGVGLTYLFGE